MLYLISSNSFRIIDEEIDKIIKGRPYDSFDYLKTNIEDIVIEANYTDLFNNEKILVIKNANIFNEKSDSDSKVLEKYLNNPNPNTTIIFTVDSVDERKKIFKIMKENYHTNILKPLYESDIILKLMNKAKSNGYILSEEIAKYISNASLNNYDVAYMTLEKIYLYYNEPCKIEDRIVKELTSISLEDNNFKFIDAYFNDDYNLVNKMIKDFKIQKVEPFSIFNLLIREYRNMLLLKELYQKDSSKKFLMSNLKLAEWQLNRLSKRSSSFRTKDIEKKLLQLCDYDFKIKSGQINPYLGLEMFILDDK